MLHFLIFKVTRNRRHHFYLLEFDFFNLLTKFAAGYKHTMHLTNMVRSILIRILYQIALQSASKIPLPPERKNSEGHIVKIDGLGSFIPALQTIGPITDPDTVKNSRIKIKDLSFVTDQNLTRRLRCVDLLRDWEKGNCTMTAEDWYQRILEYFDDQIEHSANKTEFMLTCKTVMDLNRCGRSTASADLGILTERGEIRRLSVGNRSLYMRNIRE